MTGILRMTLLVAIAVGSVNGAEGAGPELLEKLHADPMSRSDIGGCVACHVDAEGLGSRNAFGEALEASNGLITPRLRSDFPDRFVVRTALAGSARIHFADPAGESIIMELGGERFLIDVAEGRVAELEQGPDGDASAFGATAFGATAFGLTASIAEPELVAAAPPVPPQAPIPGDQETREGVVFGSRVVNVRNGKPVPDGGIEFLIGHRFSRPLFESGSPSDLFGFDSNAQITFGVDVGVTDRLSFSVLRSNDPGVPGGTVELASALQLSNQGDTAPVSTQLRVGVDGRDNFSEQYKPHIQFVAAHTIADRLSFVVSPGVAFNTRNDSTSTPPSSIFGAEHDYTASLGIGASLRVLPTVSIVGEYVPRLAGFRGEFWDRPSVSFGVQKATFRHTFEFVVSNTFPMVTSGYTVNGTDKFRVGFNIYRRLR